MTDIIVGDKKLDSLIRWRVIDVIQEILADPDYGLTLRLEAVKQLKKSVRSREVGRVISLEEILKKHQK